MSILTRGGTAAQWTAANPILAAREVGVETDTGKLKVGNGSTAWTSLAYGGGYESGTRNITADLTFDAALHGTPSPTVYIARTGNLITLDASWRIANPIPGAAGTLFTIPSGWRPRAMPGGANVNGLLGNGSAADTAAGSYSITPSTGLFTVRGLAAGNIAVAHIVYVAGSAQPTTLPGTAV